MMEGKYFAYFLIAILTMLFINDMWTKAVNQAEDRSAAMQTYLLVAEWLLDNIHEDEVALVPSRNVFLSLDPRLENRTLDYEQIWNSSGVMFRANTTDVEVLKVQQELKNFIHTDKQVKYLVFDWVDRYALKLFQSKKCQILDETLEETKIFSLTTPHSEWKSQVTVCEVQPTI